MIVRVRAMVERDVDACGRVLHAAFADAYGPRGYRTPFGTLEAAGWLASAYLAMDPAGAFVAELAREGEPRGRGGDRRAIVGCGFLHPRGPSASIGPVASLPGAPPGVGGALMRAMIEAAGPTPSLRLFQDAFNPDSFAFYAKLGFVAAETVAYCVTERLRGGRRAPGVRSMRHGDLEAVCALDARLVGAARDSDLRAGFAFGGGHVIERAGRVVAYAMVRDAGGRVSIAPAVAEDTDDLLALVGQIVAEHEGEPGAARIPTGNVAGAGGRLLQQALAVGFRVDHLGNLMVRGSYAPAAAAQLYAMYPEAL